MTLCYLETASTLSNLSRVGGLRGRNHSYPVAQPTNMTARCRDVSGTGRTIRWWGEHEKTGYEHRTPVTALALVALEEARRHNPGIGNAPVLAAEGSLHIYEPLAGEGPVGEGREARWTRAQAGTRLAPAQAEVRIRPYSWTCRQGPVRTPRLERLQRRCSSAIRGRTRTGSGRPLRSTGRSVPDPIRKHNCRTWDPQNPVGAIGAGGVEPGTSCCHTMIERDRFRDDVRKTKELRMTESLTVDYRPLPRSEVVLSFLPASREAGQPDSRPCVGQLTGFTEPQENRP